MHTSLPPPFSFEGVVVAISFVFYVLFHVLSTSKQCC
jgi:hypothetical protein